MHLRRLLPILVFILAVPNYGFGQEKTVKSDEKKIPEKVLRDDTRKNTTDSIKSVPVTNKAMDAIRLQNKKAAMEQMHTINKAIRKSMIVNKRR
jgi:hypothetical protein